MKTKNPFSTISYNSTDFLIVKLNELITKRVISFYTFIYHIAEEDEAKNHIHLLIFPNGQVDTDSICDFLEELDPSNLLPLRCMPCRTSKVDDFLLYTSHDSEYLLTKMQSRKYHYDFSEFISSNSDFLFELVHTIDRSKYIKSKYFYDSIRSGKSFEDLISSGNIPVPQFNQYLSFYNFVKDSLYRNGRVTHSPSDIHNVDASSDDSSDI